MPPLTCLARGKKTYTGTEKLSSKCKILDEEAVGFPSYTGSSNPRARGGDVARDLVTERSKGGKFALVSKFFAEEDLQFPTLKFTGKVQ